MQIDVTEIVQNNVRNVDPGIFIVNIEQISYCSGVSVVDAEREDVRLSLSL